MYNIWHFGDLPVYGVWRRRRYCIFITMIKYILTDFWKHYRQLDLFRQTKTISSIDIIKTKSVTNAFFSSPPVFLLHFSFSFARVIFELIRCKKKNPTVWPIFRSNGSTFRWVRCQRISYDSRQKSLKHPTHALPFPSAMLRYDCKVTWLQQHYGKEELEVGGGGGEGERHFPKCFKVFVRDFRC